VLNHLFLNGVKEVSQKRGFLELFNRLQVFHIKERVGARPALWQCFNPVGSSSICASDLITIDEQADDNVVH
jgi:hypothetical protein